MSDTSFEVSDNDIAIVGLAGRYAKSRDVKALWENLRNGVECIERYSDEVLRERGVEAALLDHPSYVKAGGSLEGIDQFDAGFFGFGPKDAAILDPQLRHFIELCWEALETAGHVPSRFEGAIGVFAGCGMNAYFMHNILTNPDLVESTGLFLLRHTGNDRDFLPTTVSYKLNLTGPSVSVQTACSTSLVATHFACQSLLSGECDMALAGGVTIDPALLKGYLYRENEVLAPDGHCRAFDAKASGTVLTNGGGVVVLRRLADALEDGDYVHAVIRGSAINNDGSRKIGYLAPSVDGQAAVIAEALAVAGLSADAISYVETHGTGTNVGDPIELSALTQAFRQTSESKQFCAIGSNKPNIGHTDTAAGVASLLKVVQALEHKELPPSINYERPNPNIDFESTPFYVNATLRPWETPGGQPRRAGISSLGVGGTNAHVIVQEAPPRTAGQPSTHCEVLPISAKTASALEAATDRLVAYLKGEGGQACFADVAHTLQVGREGFEHRRVVSARSAEEAAALLESRDKKRVYGGRPGEGQPSVVFMFPGGGAQYPHMGRGLYDTEKVFRDAVDECLELVRPHLGFDLRALMFPEGEVDDALRERLARPGACLPAIFAINHAAAKLWMSWGIEPAAFTGHSLGEYNAACLAGVMSLADALQMVSLRGRLVDAMYDQAAGAMLSIPLPEAEVRSLLGERFDLAASNAPALCVVSGPSADIDALDAELRAKDVECRRLRLPAAGHSRMLDPILEEFRQGVGKIRLSAPDKPYITNLTGTWVTAEQAQDPEHWVRHLRQPVLFSSGLATLLENADRVLLEVGPGQTLSSLARQQPDKPRAAIGTLRHPEDDTPDDRYAYASFGRLWAAGLDVDWAALRAPGEKRAKLLLPTYPFEHQRYWIAPGKRAATQAEAEQPLRHLDRVEDWFYRRAWKRADLSHAGASVADALTWLVFVDSAGLGAAFVSHLEAQGQRVISVREGDAFYRFNDNEYALAPEGGPEGYAALIKDLVASGSLPDRIAHFWLVTSDERARPGSSFFHRNEEQGFYSVLFLAQALGAEDVRRPIHLAVITTGMQAVGNERVRYPEKAAVLGPVKVIPTELPHIGCMSIDVVLGESRRGRRPRDLEALARQIAADVTPEHADATVAYRDGQRFVEVLERASETSVAVGKPRIKREGVYLVTGGLGGIGLLVARHLGERHRAKLILVGRTGLPPRAEWDGWLASHGSTDPTSHKLRTLLALEAAGAEVMVEATDVANIQAMDGVVRRARARFGRIDGVFHVAGAIDDGALQTKSQGAMERVLSPKIHGTLVLDKLLGLPDLDFLVLFSSSSTVLGPAGQVDYVAASSFLNAFAQGRAQRRPYTLAINWGVWRDVGLGAVAYQRLGGRDSAGKPVAHPMLDKRLADEPDGSVSFATDWTVKDHWVLEDHRTDAGTALIPGTGYLALAHAALGELAQPEVVEIRNATFVAPLQVGDAETVEMRLRMRPDGDGYGFEVESRLRGGDEWQLHAQGNVAAGEVGGKARVDLDAVRTRCPSREVAREGERLKTAQEAHLRFGSHWRCVRSMQYGSAEALAELELLPEHQRDVDAYPLHPALLDIATGFATPLIEGYTGQQLYAPMSYERVRIHGRLPARVMSHVRSAPDNHADKEVARFDVTVCDPEGTVLVEVDGFTVRRIGDKARFASGRTTVGRGAAQPSSGSQRLTAAERLFQQSYELGIRPEEGMAALERALDGGQLSELIVSSIELQPLVERYRAVRGADEQQSTQFERPELETSYVAPRDDIERKLADFWSELLGVSQVGIQDDFFELGGHSLIAVRLFSKIKKAWDVEYSLSVLFDAPTVEGLADLLRSDLGIELGQDGGEAKVQRPRYRFLVSLQKGDPQRPPFFIVAGMFGNVLNLRHLATHLGSDQPVWALQAKGLMGDDEPHERFEDAARDYLEEIMTLQPHGPYYLGGFSGGGITAFEMAQQLRKRGESVATLVLLDSIPAEMPQMDRIDKLMLHVRKLQRQGPQYVKTWAQNRARWELEQWRKRLGKGPSRDYTPAEFRSEKIEQAFRRSLTRYRTEVYPGRVTLFRPSHDDAYDLGRGRMINEDRHFIDHENRWGQFVSGGIDVHVVTGDHDGMVLEPHVRSLAAKLRETLDEARKAHQVSQTPKPSAPPTSKDNAARKNASVLVPS